MSATSPKPQEFKAGFFNESRKRPLWEPKLNDASTDASTKEAYSLLHGLENESSKLLNSNLRLGLQKPVFQIARGLVMLKTTVASKIRYDETEKEGQQTSSELAKTPTFHSRI